MNTILFVIIAYHPEITSLRNLLNRLSKFCVLIIDNSTDDALKTVIQMKGNKTKPSKLVRIQTNSSNLGFAAGVNQGMQVAIKEKSDWIVILNQDIIVSQNFINGFTELLSKSEPGVYGPFGGTLDTKRWTTILKYPSRSEKSVTYISGSFIAVHRNVVRKVGYFYEPYFMYYEDADYCVRAEKFHFPVKLIYLKGIHHEESMGLGKGSVMHNYFLARNHLLFLERNAPLLIFIYEIVRLPRTFFEYVIRNDRGSLNGIKDYFFRRFGSRTAFI